LPEGKARAVVDFARFLQHQADDAAWERIIAAKHSIRNWKNSPPTPCAKARLNRLTPASCDLKSPAFLPACLRAPYAASQSPRPDGVSVVC